MNEPSCTRDLASGGSIGQVRTVGQMIWLHHAEEKLFWKSISHRLPGLCFLELRLWGSAKGMLLWVSGKIINVLLCPHGLSLGT